MTKFLFALLLFLFPTFLFAQNEALLGNLKLEGNIYAGKIFKHTPKFLPNSDQLVGGFEIRLLRQTFGAKEWHQPYHFPVCGLQFSYANFNDKNLGESFALLPCIQFNLMKKKNVDAYFGLAAGLAYLTKKYDRFNDTMNDVIGSNINTSIQFRLGSNFNLPNKAFLTTAFTFTHYSNAKFKVPNLGINVIGLHIGYQNFISQTPANFRPITTPDYSHKLKFDFRLGYARNESGQDGGPKNPYYTMYAGVDKRWCYGNRWQLGLWYQYDKGLDNTLNFYEPNSDAATMTKKLSAVIGDEFIIGKMSFGASLGVYIYNGGNAAGTSQNLHINYVLWSWNKEKMNQIYCGVQLKSNLAVAEYFETYIGCRL